MALRMSQMMCFSREVGSKVAVHKPIGIEPVLAKSSVPDPGRKQRRKAVARVATAVEVETDNAARIYRHLVDTARKVYDATTAGGEPHTPFVLKALRKVLKQLQESDDLLAETIRHGSGDLSWAQRGANVTIFSMRLGMEIGYTERRIMALGLCALMHDLGMLTIPEEILNCRQLTPAQLRLLHRHPIESQKIVEGFGRAYSRIGKIVVQVHERQDGGGYPHGLAGEQIHQFARIIGLADTYEAMAHPRADREALVVYHALKEIVDQRKTTFDPKLIKALIHIVSIFPLGSLVKLNNGEIGRVVGASKKHPMRPTLDILVDAQGRRLQERRQIELHSEPMLYIVDPAIREGALFT
jgi:response regulator RpfG family c-di-GMP phosphodiesterase